jgi:aspartyl-tRNA synthetase
MTQDRIGEEVRVCGWIETVRDHGGLLFFHLRDVSGKLQTVVDPNRAGEELWELAKSFRMEDCVAITGVLAQRPEGKDRTSLDTKTVELEATAIELLNRSKTPPFRPGDPDRTNETQRLTYRYLDLRSEELQSALRLRATMITAIRGFLDSEEFLEVETPVLARSTPEGARDYLVPSRLNPGCFYALPQSPQIFKQVLMIGGLDRYYQIARCFRDEDLRANRQPEFTQLDLEMSFVEEEDVFRITEGMLRAIASAMGRAIPTPLPRISHRDAIDRFGTDSPDLRFPMEIVDLTDLFADTGFEVFRKFAKGGGAIRGIGGEFDSTIAKFWSPQEIAGVVERIDGDVGDVVFFMAGDSADEVSTVLGKLRVFIAELHGLTADSDQLAPLWVYDFPMFGVEADGGRLTTVHHPFTRPSSVDVLSSDDREELLRLPSRSYDLVLNGEEIGGGSLRIHDRATQERVFDLLDLPPGEVEEQFGFLLRALEYGAPPHGGIALGLDRMAAAFAGRDSIRDVIAFPKNQSGRCLLTGAPGVVADDQLKSTSWRRRPRSSASDRTRSSLIVGAIPMMRDRRFAP